MSLAEFGNIVNMFAFYQEYALQNQLPLELIGIFVISLRLE
jgi:hypothetical protein